MVIDDILDGLDILTRAARNLPPAYADLHHIVLADEQLETKREDIEDALLLALQAATEQMAALAAARGHKKELQESQLDSLHTLANIITVASNIETVMTNSIEFSKKYFQIVAPDVFRAAFASLPIERQEKLAFKSEEATNGLE